MHKFFRKSIAALLSVLLIAGTMPYSALTAFALGNGEEVLTAVDHPDAIGEVSVDGTSATLEVDFGYTDPTLDLSALTYDAAAGFTSLSLDFPDGADAEIDGSPVTMDVYYYYSSGDDTTTEYSTRYYISVDEGDAPTFSGTITKSTTPDDTIAFALSDFTARYSRNDGAVLGSISISAGSNSSVGTLRYGAGDYTTDSVVAAADVDDLSFVPSGTGTVSYTVTAYADDADDTDCGDATLTITVTDPVAPTITYTTDENDPIVFNDSHFEAACVTAVGGTFDYLRFSSLPSTSNGKLYLGYVSSSDYDAAVNTSSNYDDADLDDMTFVPYGGYSGTVNIPYTGRNTDGDTYTGTVKVVVQELVSEVDVIKYRTDEDIPLSFDGSDFDDACDDEFNDSLDYVKFTLPSSSRGTLYVNYTSSTTYGSKVSATTKYDPDDIDDIDFVPKSGYYGTFTIAYTGYYDGGDESYTGEVEITVVEDDSDIDTIAYSIANDSTLDFDSDDFIDAFDDATNDDLDYVKFTLPSSTYGVLYKDYTSSSDYGSKVSATTKYYDDDLDDITFVPKSTYNGIVTISYKAYNEDDDPFTGKVKITVTKSSTADAIAYTINEEVPLNFDDEDFNDVCEDETDEELDYVKFTLPSTTQGKLYYNYTSASSYSSVVSSSTKYYYDSTPALSKVTFVPYKDFFGIVTIKYTGYNVDGESYSGTVKITVKDVAETNAASAYFTDVTKDYAWAAPSIDALYKAGIVTGTGASKYSPASNIIRGDFMLMLYRALGLKSTSTGTFADVPSGSYYYTAITTAKALNIAQGSGGYFYPTTPITREDAMVLVARALKADGDPLPIGSTADLSSFRDRNSVSDYAISSVGALVKAGIIKGNEGYLYPKSPVTRAEMAVILYRVTQL